MATPRLFFLFMLLGQNGLHHVANLGDVRQINLWLNSLRSLRRRGSAVGCPMQPLLKMRADLVGFVLVNRTGVGLALGQSEFRQYIKNLTALDFHLSREIVDSNLTHPPLFE